MRIAGGLSARRCRILMGRAEGIDVCELGGWKVTVNWRRLRPYLLLGGLVPILYLPVILHASMFNDYGSHVAIALGLPHYVKHVTHVLFSALFLVIHRLLPSLALPHAQVVAVLLFMLPVPLIAFSLFKKATKGALSDPLLMAFSLSLTILAPVTIWTDAYMIGYLNPIVYHNPPTIAVRLFLIPVSVLALGIYESRSSLSLNQRTYLTLLSAVLVLLATLAKPNYTLALIPACCLLAVWRWLRQRSVDFPRLVFGLCLPAALLLGLMYLLVRFNYDDGFGFGAGFLMVMKYHVPAWRIPIKLMLSLLFPVAVYLGYFKEARQDLYLNLSWLTCGVAGAMAYLLHEEGPRFSHGNLLWGSYGAVFVLMFASMLFFVKRIQLKVNGEDGVSFPLAGANVKIREAFILLVLGLHVLSGIAYYVRFLDTAPQ